MYSRSIEVKNETGLHARPASIFVACANKFKSVIKIKKENDKDEQNAKSIILLLTLCICQGDKVIISAEGEDEIIAVDSLVNLIESKFNEI